MCYLRGVASLLICFFCSWNPDTFFFESLAPKSFFVAPQEQKQSDFLQALSQLEELKKQTLRGKRPEGLKEKIDLLVQKTPVNREEYLQGRKIVGWWLFYYDWFKLYNDELSEAFLSAKSEELEKKYFSRFSEEILNFDLQGRPNWALEWDQNRIEKVKKEEDETEKLLKGYRKVWHEVLSLENQEKIEKWLRSSGVLTKSLHLIHGLSIDELTEAVRSKEKITIDLYSEAKGNYKYVILVTVTLNKTNYSFALDGYHLPKADANMDREISTLNLLYGSRVPVVGAVGAGEKFWLEEFIFGKHPIDFIMWYADLSDEQGKKSPESVAAMWKEIQLKAATQFLLLFLQDFSTVTSIKDPHGRNIIVTWTDSKQKPMELTVFDIGDLKAIIVDVGMLDLSKEVWLYFKKIYEQYYITHHREMKRELRGFPFFEVTRVEFLQNFLRNSELTDENRIFFVSSIMRYLKEDMKLVQPKEDEASRNFYYDLENDLILQAQEQIKETGSWDYILALAQKENSQKLFDKANELLKKLAQSGSSLQLRQKANDLYLERTGQKAAEFLDFKPPRRELEIAI